MTMSRRSASFFEPYSSNLRIGSRALALYSFEERRDVLLHTYTPAMEPLAVPTTSNHAAKQPSVLASLEKTFIRLIAFGRRCVRTSARDLKPKPNEEDQAPMEITPFRTRPQLAVRKSHNKNAELLPLPSFLSPVEKEKPLRVLLLRALAARSGMVMPVRPAVEENSDSDSDSDDDEETDRERRRNEFEGWNGRVRLIGRVRVGCM